jgi:hypothetical protein
MRTRHAWTIAAVLLIAIGVAAGVRLTRGRGPTTPRVQPERGRISGGNATSEHSAERVEEPATQPAPRELSPRIRNLVLAHKEFAALAAESRDAMAEIEACLGAERDADRAERMLRSYLMLLDLRPASETSPGLRTLLESPGTSSLKRVAVEVAARISDPWAVNWFTTLLRRELPDGSAMEELAFVAHVIRCLADSRSSDLARELVAFAERHGDRVLPQCIESLGTMGDPAAKPLLERLADDENAARHTRTKARFALQKLALLEGPDRDRKLVEAVRGSQVSGEFAWYRWALDRIVELNLTHVAGEIRVIYEDRKDRLQGSDPWSSRVRLLHAVYRLGGPLSAEEIELLRQSGRI